MNKAFVREPDDDGTRRCPACDSAGLPVTAATLRAQLSPDDLQSLAQTAWYCPYPKCDVLYFDEVGRRVHVQAARQLAYPKDPAAPICPCFGFTCAEIDADVAEGSVARVRAAVQRARSAEARCEALHPSGRCCAEELQRYYFKARGGP